MLAAMKLGVVVIPATTAAGLPPTSPTASSAAGRASSSRGASLAERFAGLPSRRRAHRGARQAPGWRDFAALPDAAPVFSPTARPAPTIRLLLYFTSGTTARPKLVMHSHTSYPVGHLSTMFGLGLKPGDAHLNISSPGWAKHAWSTSSRRGTPARR